MNKQKLTLSVGLVLMLLSSLVVYPLRTNAGQAVIQGTTPDSSGTSGDSFAPGNQGTSSGDGVSVDNNGIISPSPRIQDTLNELALNLVCRRDDRTLVIILVSGLNGAENAASQLNTDFVNLGASPSSVQELIKHLFALCSCRSASIPGVPVGQSTTGQLIASVKNLKADFVISQAELTQDVDINQLNAAVNAYNQIVRESSQETVQKLSQDPNFQEVGRVLKELRAGLK